MADDAGIGPKAAHELATRQVVGPLNLSYTICNHKNYLRTKHQREMKYGQAGSMLYFQDKLPPFQYAEQLTMDKENNCEAQMTINSFTELLTGPISVDLFTKDLF